jgi:ParB family chromosome partitioning protein
MASLKDVPVDDVGRNPANPRLHFPEDQLERLGESIEKEGVLVPIVVYREGDGYVLIDGERRWLCSQRLGLKKIPAVIVDPPDSRENLIRMFNIHMVRDPWDDMPTAWALGKLIEETGATDTDELMDMTGLSKERLKRLLHALELPKQYQKYVDEGKIPLNFFWELKTSVIEPLARLRPVLWQELGEKAILKAFVQKRLHGYLTDTISLRKVRPIIAVAAREVDSPEETSPLDDTIRALVQEESLTVDQAYEDTVEVVIEVDKLERKSNNLTRSFLRLLERAVDEEDRQKVLTIAKNLREALSKLIK